MNWEQKLAALNAIAETSLRMRAPGDWYVSAHPRGVVGDGFERGTYGNGVTPEAAVNNDWKQLVDELPVDLSIRIRGDRQVRWNGFMWQDVRK